MRRSLSLALLLSLACSLCYGSGQISASAPAQDLIVLVNQFRQQNGAPPLTENAALNLAATAYAGVLATQAEFSHTIGGTTATGRVAAAGYKGGYVGENIARGFLDPRSVETAWENSPGHRANLVNPNFKEIGIGIATGPFGQSWVQNFGRPDGAIVTPPPVVITPPPPVVPPVLPPPPPAAPVVSLVGKFTMYRDTAGNYFLLPLQ